MRLDIEGLDGILLAAGPGVRVHAQPPTMPKKPVKPTPRPLRKSPANDKGKSVSPSLGKGSMPPVRRTSGMPGSKSATQVVPSNPSVSPARVPRTFEVAPTMKDVLPAKPQDAFPESAAFPSTQPVSPLSMPPMTPNFIDGAPSAAQQQEEQTSDTRPQQKRNGVFIAASIAAVIAVTAAWLGGVFTDTTDSVVVPAASPVTPPVAIFEATDSNASKKQQKELEKTAELEESHGQIKPVRVGAVATASPDGLRFPGTYQRGEIRPDDVDWVSMTKVLGKMRNCKRKIVISGHACSLGDDTSNRYVSVKRAEVVSGYFLRKGFERRQLVVRGEGSSMPISDNETEQGRILNRRVVVSCR